MFDSSLLVYYFYCSTTERSPQTGKLRKIERKKDEIRRAVKGEKKKKKSNVCFFSVLNEEGKA